MSEQLATAFVGLAPAPWTGWGNYAKQLCAALVRNRLAWPYTPFGAAKTPACGDEWSLLSRQINAASQDLFGSLPPEHYDPGLSFDYAFHGFGNGLDGKSCLPLNGRKKIAIGFFEVDKLGGDLVDYLHSFDLVVAGSTWNKNVLLRHGLSHSVRVLQGVDTAIFNPIPVHRFKQAGLVIFSGGKLEIRKGQDVLVEAFRRLLVVCPDAVLIAAWCNDSASLPSIAMSPYLSGSPDKGDAESISGWLVSQGIPRSNIVVPGVLNSAQMASLIKQADLAAFPNRCEGGTNLVAMEAIACGVPTLLSANSGHLDLMRLGCPGIVPLPCQDSLKLPVNDGDNFRHWGEPDPTSLYRLMLDCLEDRLPMQSLRGQVTAEQLDSLSWRSSFERLFSIVKSLKPLRS
ncbi:glycosyltransferase family 4 protein [Synechococcus sp. BS55D]|uniref:glycosyltransferase family 4 protein n=1 Tax=Synechococcus sp. BS55D TaxID=2055943 RepID=UPI00103E7269|nr:glycosyltransferase family 4 protein [Synechococcus sp. BS55D]TCD58113.1 hypothetical protein CWE16_02090 [Synechococcus sp. BS55D]